MSKQIIMCDIDGCLADFVKGFTTLAQLNISEKIPVTPTRKQPRWDGFPGMTKEQSDATWRLIERKPYFWGMLEPMVSRSVFEQLSHFNEDRHDVYFTTNRRGEHVVQHTEAWLREHGIEKPRVILVERKGELARAIGATYMIDDKAGNAVYAAYHAAPRLKSYIIDRPYNQFDAEVVGSKVTRVTAMEDFLEDVWKEI